MAAVCIVVPSAGTSAYGFCCARGKVIKQVRDSPLEAISNGDTDSVRMDYSVAPMTSRPSQVLLSTVVHAGVANGDGMTTETVRGAGFRRCNMLDLEILR